MNLQVLKRTRKSPAIGDVFVYRIKGHDYGYGRVIRTDCREEDEESGDTLLIYIYDLFSKAKEQVPPLDRSRLLIPPVMINRLPWVHGYLEVVENRPLQQEDVLPVHCFWTERYVGKRRYFDEYGNELKRRSEPCGFYGVSSFGTLDARISKALGIPEVPDDEEEATTTEPAEATTGRRRDDVEHAVLVHIAASGDLDLDNLEDPIEQELDKHDVGELDGHEIALDGSHAVIYLYGKDADLLADVVLPVINKLGLPAGSYIVKRYGEPGDAEERVEL